VNGDPVVDSNFEIVGNEIRVKAGANLDYEAATSHTLRVQVTDSGGNTYVEDVTLSVADVNEEASAVVLDNLVTTLDENTDTSARIKIADIVVTDDALGTNALTLSGADAALFEIDGTELYLRAGTTLNFEGDPSFDVTVEVADSAAQGYDGNAAVSVSTTLSVADVNEEASAVVLDNLVTTLDENTDTSARIKIADIVVTDDALGTNALTLSGADAALFEIDGTELFLRAGTTLNFEDDPSFDVTVEVADAAADGYDGNAAVSVSTTLSVADVNEEASAVVLDNLVTTLDENTDTSARIKIADIVVTDDALGTNALTLSGADAALFEIDGTELYLRAGTTLNFEGDPSFDVTVEVADSAAQGYDGNAAVSVSTTLSVADVNEEASAVVLDNLVTTLDENTDTSARIKIADIVVTDDALGTNALTLSGANAALFEIDGTELFLRAGTTLNFEGDPSFDVTVEVADSAAQGYDGNAAVSVSTTLSVADVNEEASAVVLDNLVTTLDENTDTSARIKIADIVVTDDALGTNALTLSGADAALFEIDGTELYLRAGTTLNFEGDPSFDVTVEVADAAAQGYDGNAAVSVSTTLSVADVNEEASAVVLDNLVTTLDENTDTSARIKIADIVVTDDALGTNALTLSGANAALFEIDGTELFLRAGTTLNFEGDPSFDVTVEVADSAAQGYDGNAAVSVSTTLSVADVNEEASAVVLDNLVTTLDENTDTSARIKIADIVVTDDALGTNALTLSGADAALFEIDGTELYLRAGTTLNFEGDPSFDVTVEVADAAAQGYDGNAAVSVSTTLSVADVNEEASAVVLDNLVTTLDENTDTSARIKIADIVVTDDALGTNALTLSGADAALFEIDGTELFLRAGTTLNFEGDPSFDVTVEVADNTADGYDGNAAASVSTTLSVADVNEAATAVTLSNVINTIDENTDTSSSIKVADISVTDDALGTNVLSLSGADSAKFEIVDNGGQFELHLRAGETLDFESDAGFDVTVNVDDAGVGGTPDASQSFTLNVTDVNEAPTNITLSGNMPIPPAGEGYMFYNADGLIIDGNLDANWATSQKIVDFSLTADSAGDDANDLSVTASLYWNEQGLFVAGYVIDESIVDQFSIGSNSHWWDSFEIYIDPFNDGTGGAFQGDDMFLGISLGSNDFGYLSSSRDGNGTGVFGTDIITATQLVSDGYTVESFISWSALGISNPTSGDTIRMGIAVNDADIDTGRESQYSWTQGGELYNNPENFNTTTLQDATSTSDTITENSATGTVVGTLSSTDPDSGETFTYALVDVNGDPVVDSNFEIVGNEIRVKAGADLDYETATSHTLRVQVTDSGGLTYVEDVTINLTDVNEEASAVELQNLVTTLDENTDTSARIKIADIVVTDDALGTNALTLSGADAALFEIDGTELYLRAGTTLNFEGDPSFDVTVEVADSAAQGYDGNAAVSVSTTLSITDVNEAPTDISTLIQGVRADYYDIALSSTTEHNWNITPDHTEILSDISGDPYNARANVGSDDFAVKYTGSIIIDEAGTWTFGIHSDDGSRLFINGVEIVENDGNHAPQTRTGTVDLTQGNHQFEIRYFESGQGQVMEFLWQSPSAGSLTTVPSSAFITGELLFVNQDATAGFVVATLSATDSDSGDTFTYALVDVQGDPVVDSNFEIVGNEIRVKSGHVLDYETATSHTLKVQVTDNAGATYVEDFTVNILNPNEAPTAIVLSNVISSIDENTDTTSSIKIADISVTDDTYGTNVLSLSGSDASSFEIVDNAGNLELHLRAGEMLDFEAQMSFDVTVNVDDNTVGGAIDASADLTLNVTDVSEFTATNIFFLAAGGVTSNYGTSAEYSSVTGSFYEYVNIRTDWETAMDSAQASMLLGASGTLVNINSQIEDDYVSTLTHQSYWIGASDKAAEGEWYWYDGDVAVQQFWSGDYTGDLVGGLYVNWESEEPNNHGSSGEDYAEHVNGYWNDQDNDNRYIIEWTAEKIEQLGLNITENVSSGTVVATMQTQDADMMDTFTYALVDAQGDPVADDNFEIVGNEIRVKAGAELDYETATSHTLRVQVTDSGGLTYVEDVTINLTDVNEEASAVELQNLVTTLDENTDTSARIKIADIVVTDDALGTNALTLSGADAALFEIDGTELYLRAGTTLNFEATRALM
jgi:protocadherin Fat 4